MKFAVFTHVVHRQNNNQIFGYAPYIYEMNIWGKYVSELKIIAPQNNQDVSAIDASYNHQNCTFSAIKAFDFLNLKAILKALVCLPQNFFVICKAMSNADHIQIRCPGNVGLLACVAQIFFPKKSKTAKYAGNWDPKAKQPLSYKLQKWILNNTLLTRNMQVLVYGQYPNQSHNIKPFFTATYSDQQKTDNKVRNFDATITFLFVGTLTSGKRPLYAVQLIEQLLASNTNIRLEIYGEGAENQNITQYIQSKKLGKFVFLNGNQHKDVLQVAYQNAHFLILPSKSEGWPKAVAEAMFWGCVPISTNVSCINYMLDNQTRGLILDLNLKNDVQKVNYLLENHDIYNQKSLAASQWSQNYTTNFFESEIQKLLQV